MKILVPALLALSFPVASLAAPAKALVAKARVSIAPEARAIFARASRLYGAAQGLSVRWKGRNKLDEAVNGSLDFDRAGRLRLKPADELFDTLVVMDGTEMWILERERVNERGQVEYKKIDDANEYGMNREILETSPTLSGILGRLLFKIGPFDGEEFKIKVANTSLREYRSVMLTPQPLDGEPCDRVRISETFRARDGKRDLLTVEQQTYWFARSNGRLMRLQEHSVDNGLDLGTTDYQITKQTFNPTFAPDTFKFVPPKGAVLAK